ncbi:MAG: hypothetical protein ACI379_12810 [Nocardioides sp.]|uniref:hypothetical protein n=1 Tax=Nocardioides sp. TaxID=35761 RepID=UPI003F12525A
MPWVPALPPPPPLFRDDTAASGPQQTTVLAAVAPALAAGARPRTQVMVAAGAALVLVVGVVAGCVVGYQWWRDRPLHAAVSSAGAATDAVLSALADADDLGDLSAAGAEAPEALSAVEAALADVEDVDASFHAEAWNLLSSEADLLEAVVPLEALTPESLTAWGTAYPVLSDSVSALGDARSRLAEQDVDAGVRDPRPAWANAARVVRTHAAEALDAELASLVTELATVRNTTGAAVLGARAAAAAHTAEAALTGTEDEELVRLQAALGALGGLSRMAPDALEVWAAQREPFVTSSAAIGIDPTPAAESMDTWVAEAQTVMAAWREEYAAAEASRSEVTAGLDAYAETVRGVMRRYQQARDTLSDVVGDSTTTSHDVEWAMGEGVTSREQLYAELAAATAPPGLETTHAALLGVLDRGVQAVREGHGAVAAWNLCWENCPEDYRDTEGWQSFSSASEQIRTDWAGARRDWNTAFDDALAAVDAVPLPALPDV